MFRRELRIQLVELRRLRGNVLQARVLAPMPRGAAGGGHADGGDDRQDRSTTKILTEAEQADAALFFPSFRTFASSVRTDQRHQRPFSCCRSD
jgi:hypothetical protein